MFSAAKPSAGAWLLPEQEMRSEGSTRGIDFEKSLETWINWLVSSRAARNFRQNKGCLAVEFSRKKYQRDLSHVYGIRPPNTT